MNNNYSLRSAVVVSCQMPLRFGPNLLSQSIRFEKAKKSLHLRTDNLSISAWAEPWGQTTLDTEPAEDVKLDWVSR